MSHKDSLKPDELVHIKDLDISGATKLTFITSGSIGGNDTIYVLDPIVE